MQGSDSLIDYEKLVSEAMRDAMRGVLRTVLIEVAKTGLPGDHHFYISFNTNAPGVSLSKRLMERYPEEMTIVLQHRFWDLFVHADRFEVKLQFNSIPEKLVVPFEAIRVFVDPSVRFGHQFDEGEAEQGADDAVSPAVRGAARGGRPSGAANIARTSDKRRPVPRKRTDRDADAGNATPTAGENDSSPRLLTPKANETSDGTAPAATAPAAPAATPADEGAKVVSLDKFRKK